MEPKEETTYKFLVVYHFGFDMLDHNCKQAGVFELEVFILHFSLCCIKLNMRAY